jgi:hypothetical protein
MMAEISSWFAHSDQVFASFGGAPM